MIQQMAHSLRKGPTGLAHPAVGWCWALSVGHLLKLIACRMIKRIQFGAPVPGAGLGSMYSTLHE